MSGDYFATVSLNGCTSALSDPLPVLVNATPASYFQIPNAFVPGSSNEFDNKFRIFYNTGFDLTTFKGLRIYNRAGQLIKELKLITDTWDGRGADGNLLEADVYIWVVNLGSSSKSGTFILLK